jgi:hypothetical protein
MSMSGTLLQFLGIVAVIALVATILIRPSGIVVVVLAVGVVIAGIVVSWHDVVQYREQQAAVREFNQRQTEAGVTVPPPNLPRSGS